MKLTLILIGVLAGLYALIAGIAWFVQSWLIFPAGLAGGNASLPSSARHIELQTSDGEHVVIVRIPPSREPSEPRPLLLGFGGNAWNADAMAIMLHQIFPEHEIVAQHYRGYGPSSGRPSAKALFEDVGIVHDHLVKEAKAGIVAVGFSLGGAVAVELAAIRPIKGVVLVTPFDSLKELGASHYPFLPVRLLLRHEMEPAARLHGVDLPVALITAANDTVISQARSAAFREVTSNLRMDVVIDGAGHNEIYDRVEFIEALRSAVDAVAD